MDGIGIRTQEEIATAPRCPRGTREDKVNTIISHKSSQSQGMSG